MKEHGICAKCKKSVGCPYADDRIKGCKKFVLEDELELTNKEYIRTCSTDELARVLVGLCDRAIQSRFGGVNFTTDVELVKEWLKKPHEVE